MTPADLPDPTQVLTWPQALVAVVIILCVLVWPGVLAWINSRSTKALIEDVRHEVNPNSGKSMRDSTNRTEAAVQEIQSTLGEHVKYAEERDVELDRRLEALEAKPRGIFRRR
ncbi:hypothetical protein [Cellulosimicrobium arenosum]|uniref:Uncharacterized protein n=1 Tax=Cellulosimicrobium arenosum TaxID=2708133 RepID=A0A927G6A5_9MICO|nr:hypothetical protein [Cellulosimicrobium arenosum]MBD8077702.1 hypothetical protein [Cellulosimicrobium arenosum]